MLVAAGLSPTRVPIGHNNDRWDASLEVRAAAQDALSAREQAGDERRKATLRIEALDARRRRR